MYARHLSDPVGKYDHLPGVFCSAQAARVYGGFFACQNGPHAPAGGPYTMRYQTPTASGFTGKMSGSVGIAVSSETGFAVFFVSDLHGTIWYANYERHQLSHWYRLGGHVLPGVSAGNDEFAD